MFGFPVFEWKLINFPHCLSAVMAWNHENPSAALPDKLWAETLRYSPKLASSHTWSLQAELWGCDVPQRHFQPRNRGCQKWRVGLTNPCQTYTKKLKTQNFGKFFFFCFFVPLKAIKSLIENDFLWIVCYEIERVIHPAIKKCIG